MVLKKVLQERLISICPEVMNIEEKAIDYTSTYLGGIEVKTATKSYSATYNKDLDIYVNLTEIKEKALINHYSSINENDINVYKNLISISNDEQKLNKNLRGIIDEKVISQLQNYVNIERRNNAPVVMNIHFDAKEHCDYFEYSISLPKVGVEDFEEYIIKEDIDVRSSRFKKVVMLDKTYTNLDKNISTKDLNELSKKIVELDLTTKQIRKLQNLIDKNFYINETFYIENIYSYIKELTSEVKEVAKYMDNKIEIEFEEDLDEEQNMMM